MIQVPKRASAQAPFDQLRKIAPPPARRQQAKTRDPGEQQQEYRQGDGIGVNPHAPSLAYFFTGVVVTGPMPTNSSSASPSLAPSKCTVLAKSVTTLPAGIG